MYGGAHVRSVAGTTDELITEASAVAPVDGRRRRRRTGSDIRAAGSRAGSHRRCRA